MARAKISAEDHAKLADALKAEYDLKDDHYLLKVEAVDGYELAGPGFRKALEDERKIVKSQKTELEKFKDIDPDKARDALGKLKEIETWSPEEKVKQVVESKLKDVQRMHAEELKKTADERDELRKYVNTAVPERDIAVALDKHKGNAKLLIPAIMPALKVVKDGDKYVTRVLDASGNERTGSADGSPMTVEQLVTEYKKSADYAPAFFAGGQQGSGSGSGQEPRGAGSVRTIKDSDLSAKTGALADIAAGKTDVIPG